MKSHRLKKQYQRFGFNSTRRAVENTRNISRISSNCIRQVFCQHPLSRPPLERSPKRCEHRCTHFGTQVVLLIQI